MTQTKSLTKQELRRINLRWIWNSQIGWNYERMQGLGYLTTMLPLIEKLYRGSAGAERKSASGTFCFLQHDAGDGGYHCRNERCD